MLIATACGAVLNIILNFIFIPEYGMVVAAATTLISYVLMVSLSYIFSQRVYLCEYRIFRIVLWGIVLCIVLQIMINTMIGLKLVVWLVGQYPLGCYL